MWILASMFGLVLAAIALLAVVVWVLNRRHSRAVNRAWRLQDRKIKERDRVV